MCFATKLCRITCMIKLFFVSLQHILNHMTPLHKADILKSLYIDYAIDKFGAENVIIGNEIMYGTSRKVVDLLLLNNNHTYAIEVKSDEDNYLRLNEQISEYKQLFDYVIVVVGGKHKKSILSKIPKDIGIFIIENHTVTQIQRPSKQKKLSKTEILYSIPSCYLHKHTSSNLRYLNSDEIRIYFQKNALTTVRRTFYNYLYEKLYAKYQNFINARGETTCVDALSCFTSLNIIDSANLSFYMNRHPNRNPVIRL